jgi:membrane associated rhomboid family serine protease
MIPIRDNQPSRRFPFVNWFFIVANTLVFLFEISLGSDNLNNFILNFGLTPDRFLSDPMNNWITFFTSIFLHGSWLHLIFNMLALFIFGDNIEDRLGHIPYFIFYIFGGLIASGAHIFFNSTSTLPTVGASGAIAAVLGAYLILYPRARVLTIIPIFFFIRIVQIPAPLYLGFWFLSQLLSGTAQVTSNTFQSGGVAWWAHIGGFVFGAVIALFFYRRPQKREYREYPHLYSRHDRNY